MKVDLPVADSWYAVNDKAREFLGIGEDPDITVQVYLGVRHALWEITQALAQTFSHRRTVAYAPFTGPESEFVALQFAKQGYTIKSLSQDEFNQPKGWMDSIGKQTLCLISAYDDPATGELYQTDSHVSAMKDQRIFRVLISHSYHRHYQLGKVGPYDVQIVSLTPELAFAVLGDRAKITPSIASNLAWENLSFDFSEKLHLSVEQKYLEALGEFKKSVPQGFSVYQPTSLSLPDRCLLFCVEVEGLSLATKLASLLNAEIPEQGEDGEIETLSLCRWQDPRQIEWLSAKGLTPEKLRGSLLLSTKIIGKHGAKKTAEALEQARKELLSEQTNS